MFLSSLATQFDFAFFPFDFGPNKETVAGEYAKVKAEYDSFVEEEVTPLHNEEKYYKERIVEMQHAVCIHEQDESNIEYARLYNDWESMDKVKDGLYLDIAQLHGDVSMLKKEEKKNEMLIQARQPAIVPIDWENDDIDKCRDHVLKRL